MYFLINVLLLELRGMDTDFKEKEKNCWKKTSKIWMTDRKVLPADGQI